MAPLTFHAQTIAGLGSLSSAFQLQNVGGASFGRAELSCIEGGEVSATISNHARPVQVTRQLQPLTCFAT